METAGRGVLDTPLEPVVGLAEGETWWRGMTARKWAKPEPRPINYVPFCNAES
jgi:hypothetical protein